ncbi:MAG TPA: UDP-4-amino-4,6-dideoxy-N-acetyl-beta-L-altrosamine transaminase [Victivallales bacterium]|nr:UDP-4-amino-4,6-dideoxy-N-acetyl-beta-L-altrosamine transaminase [Victivallales bacterium]
MIPYGKQTIDDDDIQAVIDVLKSDWLTTGPKVDEFEEAIASFVNNKYSVAVSSGTAALHCAMFAAGIKQDDEVITTPMTFAASSNAILYMGAMPVFVDIEENTLLIDASKIEEKVTDKTKAIVTVDYAGQPCNYDSVKKICNKHNLIHISDGCHALGAEYKGEKIGSLADMTCFSFHPVKHITTGEGGIVTTNNSEYYEKLCLFRNHGITTDHSQREEQGNWFYEMTSLGFNYRITDIQCALGISQLKKLPDWLKRRNEIADKYDIAFQNINIRPLVNKSNVFNAYHLYVVKVPNRDGVFNKLRKSGIGVNVHYIPVHLHPYYKKNLGTKNGDCPISEKVYEQILSLSMYPGLTDNDQTYVINTIKDVCK